MQSSFRLGLSHWNAIGPRDNGEGQVEKNVQDARNRLWQVMPVFADLAELNQWLEDRHAKGVLPARHRFVGRDAAQGLARVHL